MVKRGKNQKQKHWSSVNSKLKKDEIVDSDDMDDEIDAFHKKRDMIPLDINDDSGDSDEDDAQPVFNYKGIDGDEDDDDEEENDEDEGNDEEEYHDTGLAAKIVRQQKFLREKTGGVEDEFLDDAEEDEKKTVWSKGKSVYYGGDNELQSSDEDVPAEEEEEVIRLQKERAQSLRDEDFGLPTDDDVSDGEPTLGEIMVKGKTKFSADKDDGDDAVPIYKEVKKDLNSMSKDEQMDAVYSSAPELAGLLAELNDAFNDLETQVNPLLGKVKKVVNAKNEGKNYLEVKQLLLHAYCQAIVFYLLLKSEGHPVRDHPVIARIVEIKSLLDKTKELDQFIPDGIKDAIDEKSDAAAPPMCSAKLHASSFNSIELNDLMEASVEINNASQIQETVEPVNMQPAKSKEKKRKLQDQPVSSESVKMLQYRAALEERLKLKTVSGLDKSRTDGSKKKLQKTATGKVETDYDFDDDVEQLEGATRNNGNLSSKLSSIIPAKKKKGISGDDDLPERDDLGERRWKHELRVLSRAGINSNNDAAPLENEPESLSDSGDDVVEDVGEDAENGSGDDFYDSIKRQRDLKLRMKAEKFSRNPEDVPEADTTVDGKRNISAPMEKNRGLTRNRKKQNPRVVKRTKYDKAKKRRQGQVREIRKQTGPYEWEKTGINPRVSKSIRFKS
ncbi:hypothetical protein vseg_018711 [Gypsophila vaccaria]